MGRKWIAFPHRLSFGIICGRSHLCDCIQQMAVPFPTLGGSDPKMIQKYIWPMIQSIFDLEGVVVS